MVLIEDGLDPCDRGIVPGEGPVRQTSVHALNERLGFGNRRRLIGVRPDRIVVAHPIIAVADRCQLRFEGFCIARPPEDPDDEQSAAVTVQLEPTDLHSSVVTRAGHRPVTGEVVSVDHGGSTTSEGNMPPIRLVRNVELALGRSFHPDDAIDGLREGR